MVSCVPLANSEVICGPSGTFKVTYGLKGNSLRLIYGPWDALRVILLSPRHSLEVTYSNFTGQLTGQLWFSGTLPRGHLRSPGRSIVAPSPACSSEVATVTAAAVACSRHHSAPPVYFQSIDTAAASLYANVRNSPAWLAYLSQLSAAERRYGRCRESQSGITDTTRNARLPHGGDTGWIGGHL